MFTFRCNHGCVGVGDGGCGGRPSYAARIRMWRKATRPVCAWMPTNDGAAGALGRPRAGSAFTMRVVWTPLRVRV